MVGPTIERFSLDLRELDDYEAINPGGLTGEELLALFSPVGQAGRRVIGKINTDRLAEMISVVGVSDAVTEIIKAAVEWSDTAGTITLGGTAQTALAADPDTVRLKVAVPLTAVDSIYIGLGVAAVVGVGDPIGPGQSYDSGWPVSAADKLAVSVISATTGVAFTIRRKVMA